MMAPPVEEVENAAVIQRVRDGARGVASSVQSGFFLIYWTFDKIASTPLPVWLSRRVTFYRLHFLYFVLLDVVGTLLIFLTPGGPSGPISFVDALFSSTSALTVTGLVTVNMNVLSTADKVILLLLMILGSHVFTSLGPLWIRRYYFHKYLQEEDPDLLDPDASTVASPLRHFPLDSAARSTELLEALPRPQAGGLADSSASLPTIVDVSGSSLPTVVASGSTTERSSATALPLLPGVPPSLPAQPPRGASPSLLQQLRSALPWTARLGPLRSTAASPGAFPPGGGAARGSAISPLTLALGAQLDAGADVVLDGMSDDGSASHALTWSGSRAEVERDKLRAILEKQRQLDAMRRQADRDTGIDLDRSLRGGKRLLRALEVAAAAGALDSTPSHAVAIDPPSEATPATPMSRQLSGGPRGPMAALPMPLPGSGSQRWEAQESQEAGPKEFSALLADEVAARLKPSEQRLIELRALELLSWLVPLFLFGLITACGLLFVAIVAPWPFYREMLASNSVSVVFNGFFQSTAAFANSGLSLLDANMVPWAWNAPYLLLAATLILLGNTLYAPTLRFVLLLMHRCTSDFHPRKYVCRYLLDHPRKCYTHLYPARATFWLVITVIAFNVTELVFFCALDFNSEALADTPPGFRFLDGLFQSISTRCAGFAVVAISQLSPAMLVLYTGLMYVAMYPVYLTRQASREQRDVYDREDIGVFLEDLQDGVAAEDSVLAQSRKLVGRDSVLLFVAVFVVCIIQAPEITGDPSNFSIFSVLFEVISAYCNNGLSLGYTCPSTAEGCVSPPYSFSGVWKTPAKLVLVFLMLMGRNRGLPDNIDAAIVIPDKKKFRRTTRTATRTPSEIFTRALSENMAESLSRSHTHERLPVAPNQVSFE